MIGQIFKRSPFLVTSLVGVAIATASCTANYNRAKQSKYSSYRHGGKLARGTTAAHLTGSLR
ncbi:MAG: hypothetical protein HC840_04760 [Leptolyngbyaceae cyanobacterium RM2_2_4]|nr:hypothetical protein [Leptolyngbyaceae cyanobacterium SM1_4_3]NJN90906.1 hypothetical protein [Leptolyngbyaceae cyanobacterium SL_5_14]NJO48890.1 hypothetical protein [Leptolyngbyaceae cyanobacterium RM2_2_4]